MIPVRERSKPAAVPAKLQKRKGRVPHNLGAMVEPGKVISKGDRHDSKRNSMDGLIEEQRLMEESQQQTSDKNWGFHALATKFDIWKAYLPLETDRDGIWISASGLRINIRDGIMFLILFLLVFVGLWEMTTYLHSAVSASAACIPSTTTVFMPVTTTVTYYPSSSISGDGSNDVTSTVHSTIYSTSTHTSTVTVLSALTSATVLSSSGGPSYFYGVNSGTTSWLNGVSPSSGAVLTTATTSFFLSPVATLPSSSSDTTVTIQSTATDMETFTPPPYTSTVFSILSPDLTTTSTRTRYTTISLSNAPSSSQSSHPGMGSAGWNTSSSPVAGPSSTVNGTDAATTMTMSYFLGTGNMTTFTGTTLVTTTAIVGPLSTSIVHTAPGPAVTSSSGSEVAPISATLSSISLMSSSSTLNASTSTSSSLSSSSSATMASTDFPATTPGTSSVFPNASSALTATGPSPYAGPTGMFIPPRPPLTSASLSMASSSIANGLTASQSTTASAGNASTTAGVVIPVTKTMSSGSVTTVVLETTSTTLALLGGTTSTVSGYFVFNGTTTMPYMPGSAAGPGTPLPAISGTLTWPMSSSAVVGPLSSSSLSSTQQLPTAHSTTSNTTPSITAASSAMSISVPVNGSAAALSAISSVMSDLTASDSSSVATAPTTAISSTSRVVPAPLLPPTGSLVSLSANSSTTSLLAAAVSTVALSSSSLTAAGITGSAPSVLSNSSTSSATLSSTSSSSSSSVLSTSSSQAPSVVVRSSSSTTSDSSVSSPASLMPATSGSGLSSSALSTSTLVTVTRSLSVAPSSSASKTSASSSVNPIPSSATATPTACGEHGPFTLSFDDLPNFVPTNQNQTDITQAPPVPNPYNHLTFDNGYVYGPSPRVPYVPESAPKLAVFLAGASGMTASSMKPGEIGDGPYEAMSAFWFDAYSAFFGCDNSGTDTCTLVFTGYTWSPTAKDEIATYNQNATISPCAGIASGAGNCKLQQVSFPASFRSLSGLQIQAFVGTTEKMFFVDDLALGWSNNTCAAGLTRLQHQ